MLEIHVDESEQYNEETNEFFYTKPQTLKLEHSLVSISKWESKWHKAFLSNIEKTQEEVVDYIRCMTINQVDPLVYAVLSQENVDDIMNYIQDPMTATTIKELSQGKNDGTVVTSELVYYWMVAYRIPFECEKWHFNRLITLIKLCNEKNKPPKQMSQREILNQNHMINAMRKRQLHTKG